MAKAKNKAVEAVEPKKVKLFKTTNYLENEVLQKEHGIIPVGMTGGVIGETLQKTYHFDIPVERAKELLSKSEELKRSKVEALKKEIASMSAPLAV